MISGDGSLELQEAVFNILSNDLDIQDIVGSPARVYDDVPQQNTEFPYITIGDDKVTDGGTHTDTGSEVVLWFHFWARDGGKATIKAIHARVYDLMHEQDIEATGLDVYQCRFDFFDSFVDPDGSTRHGVARYRVLTTKTQDDQ